MTCILQRSLLLLSLISLLNIPLFEPSPCTDPDSSVELESEIEDFDLNQELSKFSDEAMNNLISSARSHIEKESSRIKLDQIQLDGFEMYTIQDIIGYATYGKQSIEPSSIIDLEKFRDIYYQVKTFEFQKNLIRTPTFVDVFIINYLVDSNNEGIYPTIRNLTFHNYNRFIKAFEVFENKTVLSSTLSSSSKTKLNQIYLE